MAAVTPDIGNRGATGTNPTISAGVDVFATVTSVAWSGIERESIDISDMNTTGGRVFLPGDLYDPGELSCDLWLNTGLTPQITGSHITLTITFPDDETWASATADSAAGKGAFMTGYEFTSEMEAPMTASTTWKFGGDIEF